MTKKFTLLITIFLLTLVYSSNAYSHSTRHHLIDSAKNLGSAVKAPFKSLLVDGPRTIKETYKYEVWEREKEEDRGQFKYKLFSIWRAPGDEIKAGVDGITNCIKHLGISIKELLSIPFSD